MTVEINEVNLLKAYNSTDSENKKMLETLFGKDVFTQKITDRIKTVEDACIYLGKEYSKYTYAPDMDQDEVGAIAQKRISIFRRAINESWEANYADVNQRKYYLWYKYSGSGFVLSDVGFEYGSAYVGSRLTYANRGLALHADNCISDDYKKLFTESN